MTTVTNTQVYYNRYNSATNKFKKLRFISSRLTSSSEINELQEILLENTRDIFNSMFTNGSIISGGNINRDNLTLSIESSIIYYNGFSIKLPSKILNLVSNQDDEVGIRISEDIITSSTDVSLLNPAVGTVGYKTKGAERLQITGQWALKSSLGVLPANNFYFPRYSIVDGNINNSQIVKPSESQTTQNLIERYDFDSNGNYVVSGLNVSFDSDLHTESKYLLSVQEGSAHVNGKEFLLNFVNKIKVDYPLTVKNVIGEPSQYSSSKTKYYLRNYPVSNVSQILAIKQVSLATITHGSFSGVQDLLPNTPVASVILVKQGSTTYIPNVDYAVVGDKIDWSLSGAEPAPGSTYQVTFTYVSTDIPFTIDPTLQYLTIDNTNSIQEGSGMFITYSYYLPRKDRLILNKQGQLEVLKGFPVPLNPVAPAIKEGLSLALISLVYNQNPEILNDTFKAFKMSDILNLKNRVDLIEYNIAQLSLAEDIRADDPTTTKLNIFVDSFSNSDLRDSGQTQNANIINKNLIAGVSYQQLSVYSGKDVLLDYTTDFVINQDAFSKSRQINEFTWASAPPANITLTPASYRWVADEIIKEIWEPVQNRAWRHFSFPNRIYLGNNTVADVTTTESFINTQSEIPPVAFNIKGGKWNNNEIIDVYFDSKLAGNISANATGLVDTNFAIPTGTKSGNIPVKLVGRVSQVVAESTFSAIPVSKVITKRAQVWYVWNDPIAETFTLSADRFVKSVSLFFEVNTTNFVDVFITRTVVGIPDRTRAIVKKRLYPQEIFINQWQEFVFDEPVLLSSGVEYSVIVECTDSTAKVKVAKLGDYAQNVGRWLTSQAFDSGVLLNSANGSTWSPIQDEDLAFKLKSLIFNPSKIVQLGIVNVTSITDLTLLAGTDIPAGTNLQFQAVLLDRSNESYNIFPYVNLEIPRYTGDIQITATLSTTNQYMSPAIEGDILVAVGAVQLPSYYISRAFSITDSSTKITVSLDVNEPSPSVVKVYYKNASNAWVELSRNTSKSQSIGNSWVKIQLEGTISNLNSTSLKIELISADTQSRPYARNLRFFSAIV